MARFRGVDLAVFADECVVTLASPATCATCDASGRVLVACEDGLVRTYASTGSAAPPSRDDRLPDRPNAWQEVSRFRLRGARASDIAYNFVGNYIATREVASDHSTERTGDEGTDADGHAERNAQPQHVARIYRGWDPVEAVEVQKQAAVVETQPTVEDIDVRFSVDAIACCSATSRVAIGGVGLVRVFGVARENGVRHLFTLLIERSLALASLSLCGDFLSIASESVVRVLVLSSYDVARDSASSHQRRVDSPTLLAQSPTAPPSRFELPTETHFLVDETSVDLTFGPDGTAVSHNVGDGRRPLDERRVGAMEVCVPEFLRLGRSASACEAFAGKGRAMLSAHCVFFAQFGRSDPLTFASLVASTPAFRPPHSWCSSCDGPVPVGPAPEGMVVRLHVATRLGARAYLVSDPTVREIASYAHAGEALCVDAQSDLVFVVSRGGLLQAFTTRTGGMEEACAPDPMPNACLAKVHACAVDVATIAACPLAVALVERAGGDSGARLLRLIRRTSAADLCSVVVTRSTDFETQAPQAYIESIYEAHLALCAAVRTAERARAVLTVWVADGIDYAGASVPFATLLTAGNLAAVSLSRSFERLAQHHIHRRDLERAAACLAHSSLGLSECVARLTGTPSGRSLDTNIVSQEAGVRAAALRLAEALLCPESVPPHLAGLRRSIVCGLSFALSSRIDASPFLAEEIVALAAAKGHACLARIALSCPRLRFDVSDAVSKLNRGGDSSENAPRRTPAAERPNTSPCALVALATAALHARTGKLDLARSEVMRVPRDGLVGCIAQDPHFVLPVAGDDDALGAAGASFGLGFESVPTLGVLLGAMPTACHVVVDALAAARHRAPVAVVALVLTRREAVARACSVVAAAVNPATVAGEVQKALESDSSGVEDDAEMLLRAYLEQVLEPALATAPDAASGAGEWTADGEACVLLEAYAAAMSRQRAHRGAVVHRREASSLSLSRPSWADAEPFAAVVSSDEVLKRSLGLVHGCAGRSRLRVLAHAHALFASDAPSDRLLRMASLPRGRLADAVGIAVGAGWEAGTLAFLVAVCEPLGDPLHERIGWPSKASDDPLTLEEANDWLSGIPQRAMAHESRDRRRDRFPLWTHAFEALRQQMAKADGPRAAALAREYVKALEHVAVRLTPGDFVAILPDGASLSFHVPFIEKGVRSLSAALVRVQLGRIALSSS